MIQPTVRKFIDRVAHPLKPDWQQKFDDENYQASYEIDQFQQSPSPAVQGLVQVGKDLQAKIDHNQLGENRGLLGVAQVLKAGIPTESASASVAKVGQEILNGMMSGRHPKRGGMDDPLATAESFVQIGSAAAGPAGENLKAASDILKKGIHSSYNQIAIDRNVLAVLGEQGQFNQEQSLALLARDVIQSPQVSWSDLSVVGATALDWFANHASNPKAREVAHQALEDFGQRKTNYLEALDKQPWWVEGSSSGSFDAANHQHMVAELEQVYYLSGQAPLPAKQAPEHRSDYSSELIWKANQFIHS